MQAFDFLNTAEKETLTSDDLDQRKTMILDKGLGLNTVDDLLATAGDYISFAKFGWGTAATMDSDLITAKTAKYVAKGIIPYPGGTLLEVAALQGEYKPFLQEAKNLGFKGIEVSDGSTKISPVLRQRLIDEARTAGFFVISEVGKKNPELDHALSVSQRLDAIHQDLDSGANYVIIEAREAGKDIGIYDSAGKVCEDTLDALAKDGIERLIFEAPLKAQQVCLILKYGPMVNLGNIAYDEVTALETLRCGLRGDTVGKV